MAIVLDRKLYHSDLKDMAKWHMRQGTNRDSINTIKFKKKMLYGEQIWLTSLLKRLVPVMSKIFMSIFGEQDRTKKTSLHSTASIKHASYVNSKWHLSADGRKVSFMIKSLAQAIFLKWPNTCCRS